MGPIAVKICKVFRCVHSGILVSLSLSGCVHPSKVYWAPHFVCIELVRALQLVATFLISALEEDVSCLETEFPIPSKVLTIMISQESIFGITLFEGSHICLVLNENEIKDNQFPM